MQLGRKHQSQSYILRYDVPLLHRADSSPGGPGGGRRHREGLDFEVVGQQGVGRRDAVIELREDEVPVEFEGGVRVPG